MGAGVGASRAAVGEAKAQAKGGNLQAAEAALTKGNAFAANTVEWRVETTQKLVATAHELAKEGGGSAAAVTGLTTKALQHLDEVVAQSSDVKVKANAKAMAGFIQLRYTGDPAAALTNYRAAVALTPNDAGLKETLERLEKADAILRARIKTPSKR